MAEAASTEEQQYAWPFEEACEFDQFAHMAGAHRFLTSSVELHARLHRIGPGVLPHEHLTPVAALFLRLQEEEDVD